MSLWLRVLPVVLPAGWRLALLTYGRSGRFLARVAVMSWPIRLILGTSLVMRCSSPLSSSEWGRSSGPVVFSRNRPVVGPQICALLSGRDRKNFRLVLNFQLQNSELAQQFSYSCLLGRYSQWRVKGIEVILP